MFSLCMTNEMENRQMREMRKKKVFDVFRYVYESTGEVSNIDSYVWLVYVEGTRWRIHSER